MQELGQVRAQLDQLSADLNKLMEELQSGLRKTAPGSLYVSGKPDKPSFYQHIKGETPSRRYLSMEKDRDLITRLAQQDYDRSLLRAAEKQSHAVQRAARLLEGGELEEVFAGVPGPKKPLITPARPDAARFIEEWSAVTYPPGKFDRTTTEIYSERNERVRSKSEKIIADKYLHYPLPYRYEYPILLWDGGRLVEFRPDFAVLNPRTCKMYFHQHLGKMDDPEYVNDNIWKLNVFQKNGIFLGEQLFVTYETHDQPFDDRILDLLIEKYLT